MPPNQPAPRPALQTRQSAVPHPLWGQGNSYSQDLCTLVLAINQLGPLPPDVQNFIGELRLNHVYPSASTERRYNTKIAAGHNRPCRRTGNRIATRLRGPDLLYLALYHVAFPKASHAQINAFLYQINYGNPTFRFYSHSQISRAEKLIGLSRKRGSTTAYQAFYPVNLEKRWRF